jgi:hypothetical protein
VQVRKAEVNCCRHSRLSFPGYMTSPEASSAITPEELLGVTERWGMHMPTGSYFD